MGEKKSKSNQQDGIGGEKKKEKKRTNASSTSVNFPGLVNIQFVRHFPSFEDRLVIDSGFTVWTSRKNIERNLPRMRYWLKMHDSYVTNNLPDGLVIFLFNVTVVEETVLTDVNSIRSFCDSQNRESDL